MKVHRVLIDNGSYVSLLFKSSFDQMGLSEKDLLPCTSALQGFSRERKVPLGLIMQPVELGEGPQRMIRQVLFLRWKAFQPTTPFVGDPLYQTLER